MGASQPRERHRVGFLLRFSSLSLFAFLVMTAIALNWLRWEPVSPLLRRVLRELGYAALLLMVVSYAYWPRQFLLHRRVGKMTGWLSLHIGASYGALALALIHGLGRAGTPLTFWMMVSFWAVVISGVAGFFGQKVCYRFLSFMITREVGRAGLPQERLALGKRGAILTSQLSPRKGAPYARLLADAKEYLACGWPSWTELCTARVYQPVPENTYQQACNLAGPSDRPALDELWQLVEQRRQLDIEYWFHRLAGCWLHLHRAAAAAALALLVAAHVISSIVYGGW